MGTIYSYVDHRCAVRRIVDSGIFFQRPLEYVGRGRVSVGFGKRENAMNLPARAPYELLRKCT